MYGAGWIFVSNLLIELVIGFAFTYYTMPILNLRPTRYGPVPIDEARFTGLGACNSTMCVVGYLATCCMWKMPQRAPDLQATWTSLMFIADYDANTYLARSSYLAFFLFENHKLPTIVYHRLQYDSVSTCCEQ